jgi:hypothetical protein
MATLLRLVLRKLRPLARMAAARPPSLVQWLNARPMARRLISGATVIRHGALVASPVQDFAL